MCQQKENVSTKEILKDRESDTKQNKNRKLEPEYKRFNVVLQLSPVGFIPHPEEITELKAIIRDVLYGLQWLHSHGYVHRDVRWVNIIKECNWACPIN
ncbi:hypothetical protein L211DRAFT_577531 [Terfezia boudieri ATCC MYA-4762]|uniref:Protein kinase domain-containing protein n=1 Tax=Terfezia boudieri ATCC MYA-4762 TaxID=1051890 RepID=A0A3N4LF29_9PEZI|nr:hypothetical protein L211DRAFT_577531 [Terfezia boudieri ATCC MYA-4762]